MSTYDKLATIWSKDYISSLPEQIKDRGFCFSLNNENREILITGFNPSFREGDSVGNVSYSFDDIMNSEKYDNSTKNKTFKTISSILINTSINPIEGQADDNSLDS